MCELDSTQREDELLDLFERCKDWIICLKDQLIVVTHPVTSWFANINHSVFFAWHTGFDDSEHSKGHIQ